MARAKNSSNGHLQEALASLLQRHALLAQNQAALQAQTSATDRRLNEMERINSERFARIEAMMMEHSRILVELTRKVESLEDAIREKIGFK